MAAPTIAAASVKVINSGGSTAGTASPVLSASGNNRILVAIAVPKGNSATAPAPSALVIDSAGVNSSIANGKVVHQGTLQLAQEGNFSSTCDIFFCLEPNLPTSAGAYVVDTTLDSTPQYHMWFIFEVAGCPKQVYDKLVQNLSIVNISAGGTLTETITPVDDDCLIVFVASLSHSIPSTYTSTETQIAAITTNNSGGAVISKFVQAGAAAAKTMTHTTPGSSQRQAWSAISFSGVSGGDALTTDDIESKSEVTLPGISQKHILNVVSIESASNVSSPIVSEPGSGDSLSGSVLDYNLKSKSINLNKNTLTLKQGNTIELSKKEIIL